MSRPAGWGWGSRLWQAVDASPVAATRTDTRWILDQEITGNVRLEVH